MTIPIIEENRKPSFMQRLGKGLSGAGEAVGRSYAERLMQQEQLQKQQQLMNQEKGAIRNLMGDFGEDIANLPPELQKIYVQKHLEQQNKIKNLQGDSEIEQRGYKSVEENFGKKFADIWKASPTGGRTELLKHAIDAKLRGQNVEKLLENVEAPNTQTPSESLEKTPQMKDGQIPKEYPWPDFKQRPVGYNPKEWNDEKKTWRKENAPIFEASKTKLDNLKRDELGVKNLNKLNESRKLPEGMERLMINPETGDLYGLAQIAQIPNPETQEWVKETARFQNRAKDAFGSRVTNFDLQSYMKQFPGLLNSYEGRQRILRMMDINLKLDKLHEQALQKVYQKYGLAGIPQEEADRIANSLIEDETEKLRNEYLGIDEENQIFSANPTGSELSGRTIDVIGPDGQMYEVDESEIGQLPEGFQIQ